MSDYPPAITAPGHLAPAPRRVRGVLDGRTVLDTTKAVYRWDHPWYPAYYVPESDLSIEAIAETALHRESDLPGLVRIDWAALNAWFEEDEQIFVHPRSPYVRVDALRSNRSVRVEHEGMLLAEAGSCVMLFETGLPTRYYLDRTAIRWERLSPSDTQTPCPYKGRTSAYWSLPASSGRAGIPDLAWTYDYPAVAVSTIAGLVCFYDERVDLTIDGRPGTAFSS